MIDTFIISLQHTLQRSLRHRRSYSCGSSFNNSLGVDSWGECRDVRRETIVESRLSEAERQSSAKCLEEYCDGHGDGDLGWGEEILDCNDGLEAGIC